MMQIGLSPLGGVQTGVLTIVLERIAPESAYDTFSAIQRTTGNQPLTITLLDDVPELLINLGRASGYRFVARTDGNTVQPWFGKLAHLMLSPKIGVDMEMLQKCLEVRVPHSFNIPVSGEADYDFAREIFDRFPENIFYLHTPLTWVVNRVVKDGWGTQVRISRGT